MKTLKKVNVAYEKYHFLPPTEELEPGIIYISDEFNISKHLCLCGCGELTVMPLGDDEWNYSIDEKDRISFWPSVGNYQLPCKSHYIITKGVANFV